MVRDHATTMGFIDSAIIMLRRAQSNDHRGLLNMEALEIISQEYHRYLRTFQDYIKEMDPSMFLTSYDDIYQSLLEGLEKVIHDYGVQKIILGRTNLQFAPQTAVQYLTIGSVDSVEVPRLLVKDIRRILKVNVWISLEFESLWP
jgi:hypothetical protein